MSWLNTDWEPFLTADGSPSLRYKSHEQKELMHHSGGAFSESKFIYGRTLPLLEKHSEHVSILSLGLGLGYNELLIADYFREKPESYLIHSYEKDPILVSSLLNFLGAEGDQEMEPEIKETYEKVFSFFSPEAGINLKKAYLDKRWIIHGPLTQQNWDSTPIHIFFWDAFSRKTSPELWDEEFLTLFIEKTAHSELSYLSTYACNGPMKRALRKNQFMIEESTGFQNKRQSILATRIRVPESKSI